MEKSLSTCLVCSNPISMEYPLRECILSVFPVSDEIILINADNNSQEVNKIYYSLPKNVKDKIFMYYIPWSTRLGKNEYWMLKSIAIGYATSDYILRIDADEVLMDNDDNYNKIYKAMSFNYDSYTFRVTHFWKDYTHIATGNNPFDKGNNWYNRRIYLFKNNKGYFEGLYDDICTMDREPLEPKHTSIQVMHYGHVKNTETYLKKKNQIESAYHLDWKPLDKWDWENMYYEEFKGEHPHIMKGRIDSFNKDV